MSESSPRDLKSPRSLPAGLLAPGQVVAGYQVKRLVGKGGMGEVYQARQVSMEREVALKILAPSMALKDPSFAQRFVDEARAAGKLNHPNIIHVHDVGTTTLPDQTEIHYFSMEFIAGRSLQEIIAQDKRIDGEQLAKVMNGVAQALAFAAKIGIVHRDIKPDNIMITSDGIVKVADLGLATPSQTSDSHNPERDEQGRAKVMGTPLYLSPEQARALPVDFRSDQYSLGATLYHLLTGSPPYRGADAKSIMRAHVTEPIPDPAERFPEVDEAWRQLCMRLMAKLPDERFNQATDLIEAVEAAARGISLEQLDKRKRGFEITPAMRMWAAIAGVVVVLGGGFWWLTTSAGSASEPAAPQAATPSVPAPAKPPAAPDAPATTPGPDLTAFDQALSEQRLLAAHDRLALVLPTSAQHPRVIQAAQQLRDARTALRTQYSQRIAAASAAEIGALRTALKEKPLVDEDMAVLDQAFKDRETTLRGAATTPQPPEPAVRNEQNLPPDGAAWVALGESLQAPRKNFDYSGITAAISNATPKFTTPSGKKLIAAMANLGAWGQMGEGALRAYISATQPMLTASIDGQDVDICLHRLTRSEVTYSLQKGSDPQAELKIGRTAIGLPWILLLNAALRDQGVQDVQEAKVGCLWVWGVADQLPKALEHLGNDDLTKAYAEYEKYNSDPGSKPKSLIKRKP